MATSLTTCSLSQSAKASRSRVMAPKVRVSRPSGVMTQATTDFLCTSKPQHLSKMMSMRRLLGKTAGPWVT